MTHIEPLVNCKKSFSIAKRQKLKKNEKSRRCSAQHVWVEVGWAKADHSFVWPQHNPCLPLTPSRPPRTIQLNNKWAMQCIFLHCSALHCHQEQLVPNSAINCQHTQTALQCTTTWNQSCGNSVLVWNQPVKHPTVLHIVRLLHVVIIIGSVL